MCSHFPNTFSRGTVQKFRGTPFENPWARVTQWRSWLRHCATRRKVTGSIPDGVIGTFHWHNPSGCTMALGLTHPLTEMSTRCISCGVNATGAQGWQSYHLHVLIVLKSGSLKFLEPSGPVHAFIGTDFLPRLLGLCSVNGWWMKHEYGTLMEWYWQWKTEVLGGNNCVSAILVHKSCVE